MNQLQTKPTIDAWITHHSTRIRVELNQRTTTPTRRAELRQEWTDILAYSRLLRKQLKDHK